MRSIQLPRRRFLALGAASLGGTLLAGCDRLSGAPDFQEFLASAEWLTYRVQRLLGGGHALAREFTASDVSPVFKVNGTGMPEGEEYAALREGNFTDWRLRRWAGRQASKLVARGFAEPAAADPDHPP